VFKLSCDPEVGPSLFVYGGKKAKYELAAKAAAHEVLSFFVFCLAPFLILLSSLFPFFLPFS
jgi:hypothetical protein